MMGYKLWSHEEIMWLKANYANYTNKEMAVQLNRTASSVEGDESIIRNVTTC